MAQIEIKARSNGPYRIRGPFRMGDADGDEYHTDSQQVIAPSRFGGSAAEAFCDEHTSGSALRHKSARVERG